MSSPPIENILATVLGLLLIHLLSTKSPSYPNETRVYILMCAVAWLVQNLGGSKCLILGQQ